mgnify:CR=1 FL=1
MAAQPKRARVAAYVELVGGADHCETCLLVVVARLSSDVERTREACYAFRCGEGSGRLLGACGVSTAGLRAVCCLDAADALGAPELALNHRSAGGAALAVVCGCDAARRVAAAAVAATSPGCGADIVGAYADDHVTINAEPDGRGAAPLRPACTLPQKNENESPRGKSREECKTLKTQPDFEHNTTRTPC